MAAQTNEKANLPALSLEKQAKEYRAAATGYRKDAAIQEQRALDCQREANEYGEAVKLLAGLPKRKENDPLMRSGPLFMMESSFKRETKNVETHLANVEAKLESAKEADEKAEAFEAALAALKATQGASAQEQPRS